jgi:hypothetical protein
MVDIIAIAFVQGHVYSFRRFSAGGELMLISWTANFSFVMRIFAERVFQHFPREKRNESRIKRVND